MTLQSKGLMAKAIEVLLDHQYVVQAADLSLGNISFTKVVQSESWISKHIIKITGSMFIKPQTGDSSVIRMLIQQEWTDFSGRGVTGMGVEVDTDQNYYKELFGDLAKGMGDAARP